MTVAIQYNRRLRDFLDGAELGDATFFGAEPSVVVPQRFAGWYNTSNTSGHRYFFAVDGVVYFEVGGREPMTFDGGLTFDQYVGAGLASLGA